MGREKTFPESPVSAHFTPAAYNEHLKALTGNLFSSGTMAHFGWTLSE